MPRPKARPHPAAARPALSPQTLCRDGLARLQRGDLDGGAALIARAVEGAPEHPTMVDTLGTVRQMQGRHAEAVELHRRALALDPAFATAQYNLGNALSRVGQKAEAEAAYRAALAIRPDYPEALNNLGGLLTDPEQARACFKAALAIRPRFLQVLCNLAGLERRAGDPEAARALYAQALAIEPDSTLALGGLADAAAQAGRYEEAETLCRQLQRRHPNAVLVLGNLGNALRHQGKLAEAEAVYRQAIEIDPESVDILNTLGALLHRQGRIAEAEPLFVRALALSDTHPDAHNNMGNVLQTQGRLEEAIGHYRRAIALRPTYAEAYSNLGSALQRAGCLDQAVAAYRQALDLSPDLPDALSNLGTLHSLRGDMPEASRCFQRAIALRPDYPEACNNLGNALQWDARLDEAIDAYERAIALRPTFAGARMNLGMALLAKGDFARGWREYESRWHSEQFAHARRPFTQPQWRGEPIEGRTLLLHAEQGFGDTLQFCRFAPWVAARGARVVLEVQRPLLRLASSLAGVADLVAQGDPLPEFDLHCPLLSLPAALGLEIDSLGGAAPPYLAPDPAQVAALGPQIAAAAGGRLKVGLVWSGSPRVYSPELAAVDRRRSIGWAAVAPLLDLPGVCLFGLQKDGERPPEGSGVIDLMDTVEDFADTAALLAHLDLLVSVDTAMVHLAGALGRPVWVLNRYDSCWRWLRDRDDSPWYPRLRQFRQPAAGDWETVLRRVRGALIRLAESGEDPIDGLAGGAPAASALISTETLFAQALDHHRAGRLEAAAALYAQVITRRPDEAAPHLNLGLARLGLGQTDAAARLFRRVVRLQPRRPEGHANLGLALAAAGDHAAAAEAFGQAIEIAPGLVEALNNRATSLCALGRFDEAIADLERAVTLAPDQPQPRLNLARARRDRAAAG